MESTKKLCTWMIVIFIILGVIFGGIGFNKKNVYVNSDSYYKSSKNAYVGGDAYNYIINGTYFAGYCVLCGSCFVIAAIFGAMRCYIVYDESKESIKVTANQNTDDTLPPL